jgi:hypothetical protein
MDFIQQAVPVFLEQIYLFCLFFRLAELQKSSDCFFIAAGILQICD